MSAQTAPTPQQLAVLSRVVRQVTCARRMSAEDTQDFAQTVLLKFVERNFDIFHRFTGRCSLASYLRVVVKRMLLDWQNQTYGKWRPTARAVRLGEFAVALERLINRDRYNVDEAIAVVAMQQGAPATDELQRLADRLVRRTQPRKVPADVLDEVRWIEFEDPVSVRECEQVEARVRATVADAVRQLPCEDQRLIQLRYQQKRSVQGIAQELNTDPKALYRRFDRVLRSLRGRLVAQGISGSRGIDVY